MRTRELRLAAGLSVPKLSQLTGLHRRTLQGVEKRSDCMVSTAITLAKAFNVTLDELCRSEKEE